MIFATWGRHVVSQTLCSVWHCATQLMQLPGSIPHPAAPLEQIHHFFQLGIACPYCISFQGWTETLARDI